MVGGRRGLAVEAGAAKEEPGAGDQLGNEEHEQEKKLAQSHEVKMKVARIHENMGHPSTKTLVRILKIGKAKETFIIAAANHRCGACEAQARPKGPLPSRSPPSFVFNGVVGLDVYSYAATGGR